MNYTEKYHLPQWVETDRIMMEDFNAAMASIEGGLADGGLANRISTALVRDAYRDAVQQRVLFGAGQTLDAMWVNPLASLEDAGGEGHGWNGRYGVYHGDGGLPTMKGIMAMGPKEEGKINTVSSAPNYFERAAVTFTSDGYGTLEQANIFLRRGYGTAMPDYTITMTRLDTGEVVAVHEQLAAALGEVLSVFWQPLGFPLEPHVSYSMELKLVNVNGFQGWGGFMLATSEYIVRDDEETLRFSGRAADLDITKTVTPPDWARGAVGIIRWKGDGTAALAVDGQPAMASRTRDGLNALGKPCTETEFLLCAAPGEPFELALVTEKGEGNLDIYDYGVIWQ